MPRPSDLRATRLRQQSRFESGARAAFPSLRGGPTRRTATRWLYRATIPVVGYEARTVTVVLRSDIGLASVYADGSAGANASPHRYLDGSLCMWFPADPPAMRWQFDNGLLRLLEITVNHLFREAWWRETAEWLGPEAPHGHANHELAPPALEAAP